MNMLQPYPTPCRGCSKIEGWPVRAETMVQHTGIRVEIRCRACGQQWTEDLVPAKCPDTGLDQIAGTLLLRRKPERRKGAGPFRLRH